MAGGKDISIFGVSDKVSWYEFTGKPEANATLYDDNYNPKPAYYALNQAILEYLSSK